MRKLRVDWSDQEDSFLLICKGRLTCDVHLRAGKGYLNSRGSHPLQQIGGRGNFD